jgi:lysozyme
MTDKEKPQIVSAQHLSPVGRALLQRHEGIKDYYDDIAGNCTKGIGVLVHYGHCTADELKQKVSDEEKIKSFSLSVEVAERAVRQQIKNQPLSQQQFDALVSFTYNVGAYGAKQVLANVNSGKIRMAASQMQRYNKYTPLDERGKPMRAKDGTIIKRISRGLMNRRMEESRALLKGSQKLKDAG